MGPSIDTDELRGSAANDALEANDSEFPDTLVRGPEDNDIAAFDRNLIGQRDTV